MDSYLLYFKELKLLYEKNRLQKDTEGFNIFRVMFNEHDEVNLHSKFIFELLTNLNYSKVFLSLLFDSLGESMLNEKYEVLREYKNIDLLIKSNDIAIIIENKIFAGDQERQLCRYNESVKNMGYKQEQIKIVYLTLDGRDPSDNSRGNLTVGKEILCLSYKTHISDWIKNCMKESIFDNGLRETLNQYRNLIMTLSGKIDGGKDIMELKKEILKSSENLEAALMISLAFEKAKIEIQYSFWKELENQLKEKKYMIDESQDCHYSKEKVTAFYELSKNNKFYGLSCKLQNLSEERRLDLIIEIGYNVIYWGFRVMVMNNPDDKFKEFPILRSKLNEFVSECGFVKISNSSTNWIGIIEFNPEINFNNFREPLIQSFTDPEKIKEVVQKYVSQIEMGKQEFLKKIEGIAFL